MADLSIEMPDDLARSPEGMAAAQHKSVQEIAIEGLRSFIKLNGQEPAGSPAALLKAISAALRLSASDVEELETAILGAVPSLRRRIPSRIDPGAFPAVYGRCQRADAGRSG